MLVDRIRSMYNYVVEVNNDAMKQVWMALVSETNAQIAEQNYPMLKPNINGSNNDSQKGTNWYSSPNNDTGSSSSNSHDQNHEYPNASSKSSGRSKSSKAKSRGGRDGKSKRRKVTPRNRNRSQKQRRRTIPPCIDAAHPAYVGRSVKLLNETFRATDTRSIREFKKNASKRADLLRIAATEHPGGPEAHELAMVKEGLVIMPWFLNEAEAIGKYAACLEKEYDYDFLFLQNLNLKMFLGVKHFDCNC